MAQALKKEFPDLEVAGNTDRRFRVGAFELDLDGALIWSKLDGAGFPGDAEAISLIREKM